MATWACNIQVCISFTRRFDSMGPVDFTTNGFCNIPGAVTLVRAVRVRQVILMQRLGDRTGGNLHQDDDDGSSSTV
jgi:hypothetical protein